MRAATGAATTRPSPRCHALPKTSPPVWPGCDGSPTSPPTGSALLGHSVGAAAALLHASRHHDVRAVVSLSAFAHPREVMRRFMAEKRVPYPVLGWYVLRHVQRVIGVSFDDIAPLTTLARVRCPVLAGARPRRPHGAGRRRAAPAGACPAARACCWWTATTTCARPWHRMRHAGGLSGWRFCRARRCAAGGRSLRPCCPSRWGPLHCPWRPCCCCWPSGALHGWRRGWRRADADKSHRTARQRRVPRRADRPSGGAARAPGAPCGPVQRHAVVGSRSARRRLACCPPACWRVLAWLAWRGWRLPALRRPLAVGGLAGMVFWVAASAATSLGQAKAMPALVLTEFDGGAKISLSRPRAAVRWS